jgi:hypothetical protein
MNLIRNLYAAALAIALLIPSAGIAHHSHASIDRNDVRLYSGVVVKYGWAMPHVFLKIDGPNDKGEVVEYSVEMGSPPQMTRLGWSKEAFKPGDRITWEGAHDRNKQRAYTSLHWAEKADGMRFSMSADAEVREVVEPSTDFTGLWQRSDPGGFKPHYFPPEGWPMSELGQSLVDHFEEDQNPMRSCGNPGPPKAMLVPYPFQLTRPDEDTIIMERELMDEVRVVHLNKDYPVGEPGIIGHSVGWFEDETLVIETSNFVADKWGIHTGIDSSKQKHLVERYTMSNGGMNLDVEITVTDPVYLAEPVTFTHHWRKIGDREIIQAP